MNPSNSDSKPRAVAVQWAAATLLAISAFTALQVEARSSGITGRTNRDGGAGCAASCHSGTSSGTVAVSIGGPTSLSAGQTGNFTVTNNSSLSVASRAAGVNIATDDGTLTPFGNLAGGGTELYHSTPNLTNASGDTTFSFSWTMPAGAGTGTGHTMYAVGRVWYSGNWAHAANFGITTAAPFTALINGLSSGASVAFGSAATLSTSGGAGGGAVSYVNNTPSFCSVSGTTITPVVVGTCTVTANKAADGTTSSRSDAVSMSITQAAQTITFIQPADKFTSDPPFVVSATGGGSGLPVTFTATGQCSHGGTNGATITLTGTAGTCTISAAQGGNTNYAAAPTVMRTIDIISAGTEAFPPNCVMPPGWVTAPGATVGWQAATDFAAVGGCSLKSSPLVGSFPGGVASAHGARVQITATFNAGTISFSRRVSSEPNFKCFRLIIDGTQQAVSGTCNNLGTYFEPDIAAVGASGEQPFTTVSIPITAGSHTVVFSYDRDSDCCVQGLDAAWVDAVTMPLSTSITSSTSLNGTVNVAFSQTVVATNFPVLRSASGLPPGLTFDTTNGVISGTPTTAGTYMVTATVQNPAGVNPASTDTKIITITIAPGSQVITFNPLNARLTTAPALTVGASSTGASGNPITFTASGVCTSSGTNGTTITLTGGVGICTVTANRAENANYNAATPVAQSFQVSLPGDELFPANCAAGLPPGWTVPAGSTTGWTMAANEDSVEGACSLKSQPMADSGTPLEARVQFVGTLVAGQVSFKYRVSSEPSWDCFQFFINGVAQSLAGSCNGGRIGASGEVAWTTVNFTIATAGSYTLEWRYDKDDSCCVGGRDAAWIDEVVLPQHTLTVTKNSPAGTGAGTVFSSPAGIVCGATCSEKFSGDVSLSAFPNPGSYLSAWSGGGCSGGGACIVSLAGSVSVNGRFDLITNPTPPQMPAATPGSGAGGSGRATVSFSAPTFNGGAQITLYTATCSASGQTTQIVSAAMSPITIVGMTNGVTYACSVTATNSSGFVSAASAAASVTPRTIPDPPVIGAVTPDNGQVSVAFTPPAFNGGAAITNYLALCQEQAPPGSSFVALNPTSPIVVTGLTNGTAYDCSVNAQNAAGPSNQSAIVAVTPRTTPSKPLNAVVKPREGRIVFQFDPPASDGGAPVDEYRVTCDNGSGPVSATGLDTTLTLYMLTSGSSYTCALDAHNAAGYGDVLGLAPVVPERQAGMAYWTQICSNCHAVVPDLPQLNAAGSTPTVLNNAIANQPLMLMNPEVTDLTQDELQAIAQYLADSRPPASATTAFNTPVIVDLAAQLLLGTISFEFMESAGTPPNGTLSMISGTQITFTPTTGFVGMTTFAVRGARTMPMALQGDPITVTVDVQPPPVPDITSPLAASGTNGAPFSYQITGNNNPTSYGAAGLPPGLSVNAMTGLISGTPTVGGTFMATINATNQGGTGMSATLVIVLNPAAQSITFLAQTPASRVYAQSGSFNVNPLATASSGLPVTYTTKTPAVCVLMAGSTFTMQAAGTCTIGANQAGDANFAAAPEVTRDVTITATLPDAPFIGTATPGNNQATIAFGAPANTGGTAITGYTATCTPTGLGTGMVSPITIGGLTNGTNYTCTVTATNSFGTGPASGTVMVTPAPNPTPPIITSANSATFTVGQPGSFNVTATGTPATFTFSATGTLPMGVTLNSMTGNLSGTPTQAGAFPLTVGVTNGEMPNASQAFTLTVNTASQSISFTGPGSQSIGTGSVTVAATATSGLAVSFASTTMSTCTVSGTTVTLVAVGTCTVRASQSGNANYNAAPNIDQSFTIAQGTQVLTFGAQTSPRTYMTGATFAISPLASSSAMLAPAYSSLTTAVCTLAGTTITMVRAGICTIAANQAGNANFAAAAQVTQSVTISGTAPGAPTLNSAAGGDTKITLDFSAPASDGGSGISSYTATCGGASAMGATSPINVTGLTNGMSYTCSVTATNSTGTSASSNTQMATPNALPGAAVWNANCSSGGCHLGNPSLFRLNVGGTNSTALNYAVANPGTLMPALMITVVNNLSAQQKLDLVAYIAEFIPAVSVTTAANTPVDISVANQVILNSNTLQLTGLQQVTAPANGTLSFPGGATITYTPNMGFTGTNTFTYRAFQAGIQTDPRTVTVTVTPAAPVITSSLNVAGTVGQAFSYQIAATNAPTGYTAPSLPGGLMVNTMTGAITGTPSATGSASYSIGASNSGGSGSAMLTITIGGAPQVISFPAQTTATRPFSIAPSTFAIAPTATGGASGNAIVYSSTTSSVCSVSATTVTMIAAGVCTIAANQAGNATYAAAAQATQSVTINATAPGAPVIGSGVAGNTQATVNFSAPANTGGLAITTYTASCNGITNAGAASPITVSGLTNGVAYTCFVQATNGAGTSVPSGAVMVTPVAIAFTGNVYSRKTHGASGDKDLELDDTVAITGAVTVEPRLIGTGHRIVFRFNNPVSSVTSLSVVDAAMASVGVATPSYSNNDLIVTLTGIPDNKRVTVTATGVNGALTVFTSVGFLVGGVSDNRAVNAVDISAVKAHIGSNVSIGNNYLFDLDANNVINNADVMAAKARSGLVLP